MENTQECSLQTFSLCVAHVHDQCKYLFPSFCLSSFLLCLSSCLFFKLVLSRFYIMCFSHIQISTPSSALLRYKCPFPIHPTLCPLLKSQVQFLYILGCVASTGVVDVLEATLLKKTASTFLLEPLCPQLCQMSHSSALSGISPPPPFSIHDRMWCGMSSLRSCHIFSKSPAVCQQTLFLCSQPLSLALTDFCSNPWTLEGGGV